MAAQPYLKPTSAMDRRAMGKYEVLCRLSTGGMSEIFLAHQQGLAGFRKIVVLKSILPDIRGEEEFVRMFLDEAKTTAAFNHPNIAQVYDLDVDAETLFLAMEFVQGCTLVEMARACRQAKEPIPVGFSLLAVRDTALALHYAHNFTDPRGRKQTVIHRDVAEKNIMVTYEGTSKLLDFGIAKALGRSTGHTSIGMVKGTSGYMSPEQIRGEPLDARSDIFALGVVLHECLTAMRLFHGKTPEDAMLAALREEIPVPSRQNATVTPAIDQVVLKSLMRDRDSRYASALEFARAIERAAGDLMWLPEQSGELVQRHFHDRREQTRALIESTQSGERTGELNLDKLLASIQARNEEAPKSPVAQKGPTISPATVAPPVRKSGAVARPSTPGAATSNQRTLSSSERSVVTEPTGQPAAPSAPVPPTASPNVSKSRLPAVVPLPNPDITAAIGRSYEYDNYDDDDDDRGAKTVPAAVLPGGVFAPPVRAPRRPPQAAASPLPPPVPSAPLVAAPRPPPPVEMTPLTGQGLPPGDVTASGAKSDPISDFDFDDDDAEIKTTIARPFPEAPKQPLALFIAGGVVVAGIVIVLAMFFLNLGPFRTPGPEKSLKGSGRHTDVRPVDDRPGETSLEPTPEAAPDKKPDPQKSESLTIKPTMVKPPDARPSETAKVPEPARPSEAQPKPATAKPRPPRLPHSTRPGAKVKPDEPEESDEVQVLTGKLTLVTDPPGLLVLINGQDLGATPLFQKDVPTGRQTLKLINPEQETRSMPVDIKPGLNSLRLDFDSLK